jgi:hypothetical protein
MILRPYIYAVMPGGSAESDTEASLHTYGALLMTYNIC